MLAEVFADYFFVGKHKQVSVYIQSESCVYVTLIDANNQRLS